MSADEFDFLSGEISQGDIATFAEDKVNLKREHAQRYREQVMILKGVGGGGHRLSGFTRAEEVEKSAGWDLL